MEANKLTQAILAMNDVIEKILADDGGCPWDKAQTPISLSEYSIEELFEFVDAVRKNNAADACDEMGDVIFGIMLIAQKYARQNAFDFADALMKSVEKMHRRHPHVFAKQENQDTSREALHAAWEKIKNQEKAEKGNTDGALASIPSALPALSRAYRIHAKAAKAGFTWDDDEDVEKQVEAEWLELLDAKAEPEDDPKRAEHIEHELGDMIFSLVELGRRLGVKANIAADMTCNRFVKRFEAMEKLAKEKNLDFESLSLDDKDELWNEVKQEEHN